MKFTGPEVPKKFQPTPGIEELQKQTGIRIQPRANYKALGSSAVLDPAKTYNAIWAKNLPNWQRDEKIFVLGIVLQKYEYTIVS